jgi:hypothetical protein
MLSPIELRIEFAIWPTNLRARTRMAMKFDFVAEFRAEYDAGLRKALG